MAKVMEDEPAHKGTSLHKFICQVQPYYWKPDVWELDRWFEWPPDIFALTSLLLSYTGAYRRAISPASDVWPKANWPMKAKVIATEWRNSIAENRSLPEELQERRRVLEANRDIMVDTLYDSNNDQEASCNPWEVCKVLLELHAIADEAMRGVGIIYSPRSSLIQEELARSEQSNLPKAVSGKKISDVSDKIAFFYLQANYLLALRGSLSRVPKYRGIVLPKSRTPQVGLSLRSLSNHLTFHQSEVDIAWRAFPWFNFDENTLNVMVVPWPYHIDATHFSPILHPKTHQELGPQRYFHYEPTKETALDVEKLVRLIDDAKKEVRRIHLLVFPEMSLRRSDLKRLKNLLEERLRPHEMPMIIAGVSARLSESDGQDAAADPHFAVGKGAAGFNRVILSAYYAEKWHDVIQDKHHRWRVDSQQIEQYNLGGALSGSRVWWEAIHIPRRRLSVLAANSWLTICPLICEDLARLEPVSDLIRGIGPTLVTAILLDGPQLRERWPARYASVLADDPGSSVLTLTALGMSRRSRRVGSVSVEAQQPAKEKSNVVALWKDQAKGWREIRVEEGEGDEPKVLIISALWTTESTVDGRAESDSSAVFTYQGMYQPVDRKGGDQGGAVAGTEVASHLALDELRKSDETKSRDQDAKRKRLKVLDMCELTLYTYYVDALVDSRTDPGLLRSWFDDTVRTRGKSGGRSGNGYSRLTRELVDLNKYSIQTRDSVPIELPSPHLMYAIDKVTDLVGAVMKRVGKVGPDQEELREYWRQLTDESEYMLGDVVQQFDHWLSHPEPGPWEQMKTDRESAIEMSKRLSGARVRGQKKTDIHVAPYEMGRIRLSTPLSILWSIHVRLATRRRYGTLQPEDASLLEGIEKILSGESQKIPGNYHHVYLKWKAACRERDKKERGAPYAPPAP